MNYEWSLQNGRSAYFGMEKSVSRFFHPKSGDFDGERVLSILQGNREADFLEEYRPNAHFAKVQP
jgi:hypothetical protein